MERAALGIMAKSPEAGQVKTRLRGHLPDHERVALYRELLSGTVARLRDIRGVDTWITYAPEGGAEYFARFGLPRFAQEGAGLGERMHNALAHLLGMGYAQAVLVGSDIPGLTGETVVGAIGILDGHDCVFGPSEDGGYYLVALRAPAPELFAGVHWSSPDTLEQTLARARELGLRVGLAPTLWDLDTPADLARYRSEYGK